MPSHNEEQVAKKTIRRKLRHIQYLFDQLDEATAELSRGQHNLAVAPEPGGDQFWARRVLKEVRPAGIWATSWQTVDSKASAAVGSDDGGSPRTDNGG